MNRRRLNYNGICVFNIALTSIIKRNAVMRKYESPTHQRPAEAGTNHKNPPNVTPKKIGTTMAISIKEIKFRHLDTVSKIFESMSLNFIMLLYQSHSFR